MSRIEKTYAYRAVKQAREQGITRDGDIISHIDGRNVSVSRAQLTYIHQAINEEDE